MRKWLVIAGIILTVAGFTAVTAYHTDPEEIKTAIAPVKDLYVILDHTRAVFMIIYDGSLPSNVGGGSNVRNILRRVFSILNRNKWFELVGKSLTRAIAG